MSTALQKSTIRNLTAGGRTKQNSGLQCMDIDMLAKGSPPKEQVMPGLPEGMTGAIIMHRSAGKSAIGLQLAMAVAKTAGTGSGTVLYVPESETLPVLRNTLSWVKKHHAPEEWNCIRQNLMVAPVDYYPTAKMLRRDFPGLKLLILECIDLFYTGNPNENNITGAIQLLHQMASLTGAAMLFVHSENIQNYVPMLVDRYCSIRFDLVGMNDSEAHAYGIHPDERRKYVRLANTKSDYTIPAMDTWYKKNYFGMLHPVEFENPGF